MNRYIVGVIGVVLGGLLLFSAAHASDKSWMGFDLFAVGTKEAMEDPTVSSQFSEELWSVEEPSPPALPVDPQHTLDETTQGVNPDPALPEAPQAVPPAAPPSQDTDQEIPANNLDLPTESSDGSPMSATSGENFASAPIPTGKGSAGKWGWLFLGSGILATGMGGLGLQFARRRLVRRIEQDLVVESPVTDEVPKALEGMLQKARLDPLSAERQFQLGVAMVRRGTQALGTRYLERSLRLDPLLALQLIEDPQFASLLQRAEVQRVLRRFHRDQQRKLWTGYA